MSDRRVEFTTYDVGPSLLGGHIVVDRSLEEGFIIQAASQWPVEAQRLDDAQEIGRLLYRFLGRSGQELVVETGEPTPGIVRLELNSGFLHVGTSCRNVKDAEELVRVIEELFPRAEESEEARIAVTFWALSPQGPQAIRRKIDVPRWQDIARNYPEAGEVRSQLEGLMAFRPARGGQLVLWQGPVGTGKTWALRALGWEWREWCSIHYITDPEILFGKEPAYLLRVLLEQEEDFARHPSKPAVERWRLLVLEDTGEMLAPDAKEHVGQGLSRLLNTVDGLIGQGLRILVLITTNEELQRLHPAVSRPGRCVSRIEFREFEPEEASAWLTDALGSSVTVRPGRMAVAELYAQLDGRLREGTRQPVEFAR